MMYFENYHWEDHVPRAGSWKFNLAVGALAFGLIAAAMPDNPEKAVNGSNSAKAAAELSLSALEQQRRVEPAFSVGRNDDFAQCPNSYLDS